MKIPKKSRVKNPENPIIPGISDLSHLKRHRFIIERTFRYPKFGLFWTEIWNTFKKYMKKFWVLTIFWLSGFFRDFWEIPGIRDFFVVSGFLRFFSEMRCINFVFAQKKRIKKFKIGDQKVFTFLRHRFLTFPIFQKCSRILKLSQFRPTFSYSLVSSFWRRSKCVRNFEF